MGTSMNGQSPHEADTRTTVLTVLVSGAEGVRLRAEEECQKMRQPSPSRCPLLYTSRAVPGVDAGGQIYSRQIVCSSSGDQNLRSDRHVLQRQPPYCFVACVRTGCQAGTWRHQHAREGAAQSNGREQLAHCVFMG